MPVIGAKTDSRLSQTMFATAGSFSESDGGELVDILVGGRGKKN
jgi:hypothetical protein